LAIIELSAIATQWTAGEENTFFHPSEIELTKTTKLVFDEVNRVKPKRVAFDSLSELRLLSENQLRYRRQMLAFKQFFAGRNATVLLLDDGTSPEGDSHLQSIAHGVLRLQKEQVNYGVQRRRLSVAKLRGVQFQEGNHDFLINPGGLRVFPRLVASNYHRQFEASKALSGNDELDNLLCGGIDRGTSTLLIGPAGTGKSTLALQYAVAAADRGERSIVYTFDETLKNLGHRMEGLGIDFATHLRSGLIVSHQIDPSDLAPGEFAHNIKDEVENKNARFIVIDSLNGYISSMPDEKHLMVHLHELQTFLNQHGVVTMMTIAQHGMIGVMSSPVDVTYLADNVLLFRFFEMAGRVKKALSVVKKRTGKHEDTIRELKAGPKGLIVGKPLTEFQGVLTGVPRFHGRPADILKET
jgi:circadian clock protein KaiC